MGRAKRKQHNSASSSFPSSLASDNQSTVSQLRSHSCTLASGASSLGLKLSPASSREEAHLSLLSSAASGQQLWLDTTAASTSLTTAARAGEVNTLSPLSRALAAQQSGHTPASRQALLQCHSTPRQVAPFSRSSTTTLSSSSPSSSSSSILSSPSSSPANNWSSTNTTTTDDESGLGTSETNFVSPNKLARFTSGTNHTSTPQRSSLGCFTSPNSQVASNQIVNSESNENVLQQVSKKASFSLEQSTCRAKQPALSSQVSRYSHSTSSLPSNPNCQANHHNLSMNNVVAIGGHASTFLQDSSLLLSLDTNSISRAFGELSNHQHHENLCGVMSSSSSATSMPSVSLTARKLSSSGASSTIVVPPGVQNRCNVSPNLVSSPANYLSRSRNGKYELKILSQPEEQHRARYLTEGSRGAIKDKSGHAYPVIKLCGYNTQSVKIQCFIGHEKHIGTPHLFYQASKIAGKNSTLCSNKKVDGTCIIIMEASPANNMEVNVDCIGILKERNVDVEQKLSKYQRAGFGGETQSMAKRSTRCRLVFRCEIPETQEILQAVSTPILCTQPLGTPEINKKSLTHCSINGGEELFIIGKNFLKDTKVMFRNEKWLKVVEPNRDYLKSTHLICEVPAYDPAHSTPKSSQEQLIEGQLIEVQLMVKSGGKLSEPHRFFYRLNDGNSLYSLPRSLSIDESSNGTMHQSQLSPPQSKPAVGNRRTASMSFTEAATKMLDMIDANSNSAMDMTAAATAANDTNSKQHYPATTAETQIMLDDTTSHASNDTARLANPCVTTFSQALAVELNAANRAAQIDDVVSMAPPSTSSMCSLQQQSSTIAVLTESTYCGTLANETSSTSATDGGSPTGALCSLSLNGEDKNLLPNQANLFPSNFSSVQPTTTSGSSLIDTLQTTAAMADYLRDARIKCEDAAVSQNEINAGLNQTLTSSLDVALQQQQTNYLSMASGAMSFAPMSSSAMAPSSQTDQQQQQQHQQAQLQMAKIQAEMNELIKNCAEAAHSQQMLANAMQQQAMETSQQQMSTIMTTMENASMSAYSNLASSSVCNQSQSLPQRMMVKNEAETMGGIQRANSMTVPFSELRLTDLSNTSAFNASVNQSASQEMINSAPPPLVSASITNQQYNDMLTNSANVNASTNVSTATDFGETMTTYTNMINQQQQQQQATSQSSQLTSSSPSETSTTTAIDNFIQTLALEESMLQAQSSQAMVAASQPQMHAKQQTNPGLMLVNQMQAISDNSMLVSNAINASNGIMTNATVSPTQLSVIQRLCNDQQQQQQQQSASTPMQIQEPLVVTSQPISMSDQLYQQVSQPQQATPTPMQIQEPGNRSSQSIFQQVSQQQLQQSMAMVTDQSERQQSLAPPTAVLTTTTAMIEAASSQQQQQQMPSAISIVTNHHDNGATNSGTDLVGGNNKSIVTPANVVTPMVTQQSRDISHMSLMSDAELLNFINPATFECVSP